MNRTRLIRFAQSRTSNGVTVRAAGLMVRPTDAILILAAKVAGGQPYPLDLASLGEICDDRNHLYESGPWGTRYVEPTSWFFIQMPRPAVDARRLQLQLDELSCVPTIVRPSEVELVSLVEYTPDLFHLPSVRHISGPWSFDLPLRRQRLRTIRD